MGRFPSVGIAHNESKILQIKETFLILELQKQLLYNLNRGFLTHPTYKMKTWVSSIDS